MTLASARAEVPGTRRAARGLTAFLGALIVGCASAPPPVSEPPLDAGQLANNATRTSALDAPYRLVFSWTYNEPGTRIGGRGVARVEPPYRARLDLFLSNGELAAAASVNGDEHRLLGNPQAELPPPALLWGTLGVFRPGSGTQLRGGRWQSNGIAELRYFSAGTGDLLYDLRGNRIESVEVLEGERPLEELRLVSVDGERFPRQATYRHLGEVRELRITLEEVRNVETYPSDVWDLGL